MNTNLAGDPQLDSGFAERVLATADIRATERRRWRWAGAISVAAIFVFAVVTERRGSGPTETPRLNQDKRSDFAMLQPVRESTDTADALSWLFPDADPVARFGTEDKDEVPSDVAALFDDQE